MSEPRPSKLDDPEQTRNRLEILNQFFRGMLLLNGGGCVVLLAFLQAIWQEAGPAFVHGVLRGMSLFVAGLVCSVVGQYLRYEISKAFQFGMLPRGRKLQKVHLALVGLSVLAFVIGAAVVVYSAWDFTTPRPAAMFSYS